MPVPEYTSPPIVLIYEHKLGPLPPMGGLPHLPGVVSSPVQKPLQPSDWPQKSPAHVGVQRAAGTAGPEYMIQLCPPTSEPDIQTFEGPVILGQVFVMP